MRYAGEAAEGSSRGIYAPATAFGGLPLYPERDFPTYRDTTLMPTGNPLVYALNRQEELIARCLAR
jgi:hypothetical protein